MVKCAWTTLQLAPGQKVAILPGVKGKVFLDHNCAVSWIQHHIDEALQEKVLAELDRATSGQDIPPAPKRQPKETMTKFMRRYEQVIIPSLMTTASKRKRTNLLDKAVDVDIAYIGARTPGGSEMHTQRKKARKDKEKQARPPPPPPPPPPAKRMRHADLPPTPQVQAKTMLKIRLKTVYGQPQGFAFDLDEPGGFLGILQRYNLPTDVPMACEITSSSIILHPYCVIDPAAMGHPNYTAAWMEVTRFRTVATDPVRGQR